MKIQEYVVEVNRVSVAASAKLNEEFHAGKRLFGATATVFDETLVRFAFADGLTPEECYVDAGGVIP